MRNVKLDRHDSRRTNGYRPDEPIQIIQQLA
jgi:hypothetical protein